MTSSRPLPEGRLARLTRLATLGAQTSVNLLANKDAGAAAMKAAEVLGNLRGLAAKVGQMASYVDGAVPERYRQAYESTLKTLRSSTQTSAPDAIRRVVEQELGAPVEQLFAEWADEPFASASIGQVHRARMHDGQHVAVKVQHPGIENAVESDLRNAGMFGSMVGALLPKSVETKRIIDEIQTRFREELDYHREAENQVQFRQMHACDPHIKVPEVVPSHTRRRVITTELVSGLPLEAVMDQSETNRTEYAAALWRFEFRGLLQYGLFNADPHPGNFLFQPDHRIAFLDFGCVQHLDESMRLAARHLHTAAIERDERAFERAVIEMLKTRGGGFERAAIAYVRRCFQPLFESPFKMSSAYVRSVVAGVRPLKSELFSKDKSFVMPPPGWAFMNRLQFGFYSILAKLDVELDFAGLDRELLDAGP